MLNTRTTIEYRDGVVAVVPAIVAVDKTAGNADERQARLAAERMLDDVLADSFPASDPPSWNPGMIRPLPVDGFAALALPVQGIARMPVAEVVNGSQHAQGGLRFLLALLSVFGGAGVALLLGVSILLIGLPIAIAGRGLLEAVDWLFSTTLR